jgi:hypothetical protein
MRILLTIAIASLGMMACRTASVQTTPTQKNGWVSLFDGKTLNGWHTYGETTPTSTWTVSDGSIYFDPTLRAKGRRTISNDLVSAGEYENFHLKYDWKIPKNGNSGLIFWAQEDSTKFKQAYHTGPEMQVLDNDGHPDGKINKHRAGNLYDLIAGKEGVALGPGEWNHAEIISNRGKLEFILNGVSVLTTNYGDDNWKQMIAGSKFKQWPAFGTIFKGHFALQDHGNEVWFKNIMIKQL